MRKISIAIALLCVGPPPPAVTTPPRAAALHLALDHVILFVPAVDPGKAAVESAGFRVAPGVNRHDGQGTASVTVEFQNAFLELLWPDPSVPVAKAFAQGAEKLRKRAEWRTTGWSPIGLALHRVGPATPLPIATWSVAPPWMQPGTAIDMLTPRDDTMSPSISIHPHAVSDDPKLDESRRDLRAAGALDQPNGVKRVTSVRLIEPETYQPAEAVRYLESIGVIDLLRGSEWTVEITFDEGAQGKHRDFRPALPLTVRY